MRYVGTAKLKMGRWHIDAEPHVLLKLKRVFGGIAKADSQDIQIADSLDVSRDLAWFCERYPLKVTPADFLAARVSEHRERETLVAKLLKGHVDTRRFELTSPPRDYQRQGAEICLATRGTLIGDDLGLGKTVEMICVLTDPRTRPALVVAPTHLQRQWRDEIKKFLPQLSVHILKQTTPYDYSAPKRFRDGQLSLISMHPDVLIVNYHKLHGWVETLAGLVKCVIADEVHELRSGPPRGSGNTKRGSQKYLAFRGIGDRAEFRAGASATPIFNYGGEVFYIIDALNPGALGDYDEFCREHASHVGDKPRLKEPEAFGAELRARGLMIRRTRKDVGRELKPMTRVPHHVDCDESAINAIRSSAGELARIILGQSGRKLEKNEAFLAGGEFDAQLRAATGLAKAPYVAEFVKLLLETETKVVLFGWHRAVYDVWTDLLKDFKPVLYTGSESEKQKDEAKQAFVKGDSRLLIISLRSGAGLDGLQYSGCRTVVFGELDWSPAAHEQCEGRIDRDGQPEPVMAYYLIADSGSDPVVADVLGVKRQQLEGLRDPDGQRGLARLDTGGAHVKRLAEEFLRRQGTSGRHVDTDYAGAPA